LLVNFHKMLVDFHKMLVNFYKMLVNFHKMLVNLDNNFRQITIYFGFFEGLLRGNYRPISMLSIIAKLFEKLVCSQLNMFLTKQYPGHMSVWVSKRSFNYNGSFTKY
jgi:hypothetical protein